VATTKGLMVMPGLIGFTRCAGDHNNLVPHLKSMQDLVTYRDFQVQDPLFFDDIACATRVHVNVINKEPQPYCKNNIYIWLDGEIYNIAELRSLNNLASTTVPELMLDLFQTNRDWHFLEQIDGFFAAVVYDAVKREFHLLADRHGLRYLYYFANKRRLAWASELKAFLHLPSFTATLNIEAVSNFLRFGFIRENGSWFEDVHLIPPGCVLTWNYDTGDLRRTFYWTYEHITPLAEPIDEIELADELGRRLVEAVHKRVITGGHCGLTLSGGLDSRAILAAVPESETPIPVFTFGQHGCSDIQIASRVAQVKSTPHYIFELTSARWLEGRTEAIWWADGVPGFENLHNVIVISHTRSLCDVILDGFFGDATIGGLYLNIMERFSGENEFQIMRNRGRRRIMSGLKRQMVYTEVRLPFVDNAFFELAMSIPASLRKNAYLYQLMLLRRFPEFFRDIPWEKSGRPINPKKRTVESKGILTRATYRLCAALKKQPITHRLYGRIPMANYAAWIRHEPGRTFFRSMLENDQAHYPRFVSKHDILRQWQRHLHGEDHTQALCRMLTLEIWLQQIFEGHHRNATDNCTNEIL
jgi:asparagine synthase (glutamine-hydrolysing)